MRWRQAAAASASRDRQVRVQVDPAHETGQPRVRDDPRLPEPLCALRSLPVVAEPGREVLVSGVAGALAQDRHGDALGCSRVALGHTPAGPHLVRGRPQAAGVALESGFGGSGPPKPRPAPPVLRNPHLEQRVDRLPRREETLQSSVLVWREIGPQSRPGVVRAEFNSTERVPIDADRVRGQRQRDAELLVAAGIQAYRHLWIAPIGLPLLDAESAEGVQLRAHLGRPWEVTDRVYVEFIERGTHSTKKNAVGPTDSVIGETFSADQLRQLGTCLPWASKCCGQSS